MKELISREQIRKRIEELGREIKEHYGDKKITCLVILKGSFIFASDLVRAIDTDNLEVEFVQLSSYRGMRSTGKVELLMGEVEKFRGKDLLVIEDIVDTGLTLSFFLEAISQVGVNSVKICSFLEKKEVNRGKVKVDFLGFDIPDSFVIGYGLDYDEIYRNLPYVGVMENE